METIQTYLDNLFASLPKTAQTIGLKNDLLANMEDKYMELKQSGKSENEAIGIVISEFGNIDELIVELDIELEDKQKDIPVLDEGKVNRYLEASKKSGMMIGIGVFMCILAPATLILFTEVFQSGLLPGVSENFASTLGLIPMFLLIAAAVAVFIYIGMVNEKYKYVDKSFELPFRIRKSLENRNEAYQPTYTLSIIAGVTLCILSPVILMVTAAFNSAASSYGVVALLMMVAAAVYIFIYFGAIKDSYKKLLKVEEYSEKKKEENRIIQAVSSIIWPLAVCTFLISGFIFDLWHIAWIVFPLTGILFGMFSETYTILKGKKEKA